MPDVTVFCCVCGRAHNPRAIPATALYRSEDKRWWCGDELAVECLARARDTEQMSQQRAAEMAAMYTALESVWADLESNDWKF